MMSILLSFMPPWVCTIDVVVSCLAMVEDERTKRPRLIEPTKQGVFYDYLGTVYNSIVPEASILVPQELADLVLGVLGNLPASCPDQSLTGVTEGDMVVNGNNLIIELARILKAGPDELYARMPHLQAGVEAHADAEAVCARRLIFISRLLKRLQKTNSCHLSFQKMKHVDSLTI